MSTVALAAALMCLAAAVAAESGATDVGTDAIGPTPIPFYTGNLSVSPFMAYWGTGTEGDDRVTPARLALLKRIGVMGDCDYQAWCLAEPEAGRWDFERYRANAEALHAAGLRYVPFAWVHFPPRWFIGQPDCHLYRCAEHGETLTQLTPFAPQTWQRLRAFYRAQHAAMGDLVDWMRIALPSEYGEAGYPCGMTNWLVKQTHVHPGYWCGDDDARADFRAQARQHWHDLPTLNQRWGTAFADWDAVTYPALTGETGAQRAGRTRAPADRRRWLDFIAWYQGAWDRFTAQAVAVVRESYPKTPLIVSIGYASERVDTGNDYSGIVLAAKPLHVALQTPSNVGYFAMKRVSTPCHIAGVAYYTEPPGDVPPPLEMQRLFFDCANGAQAYFEYPQNLDGARAQVREAMANLTGAAPIVDLALMCPMLAHRLAAGDDAFPRDVARLADVGRDRFDYDTLDERLIAAGALARYRVLVWNLGGVTDAPTLASLARWVGDGGTLVTPAITVESIDGDTAPWTALAGDAHVAIADLRPGGAWDWGRVAERCVKRVGHGAVIRVPLDGGDVQSFADVVDAATHRLAQLVPGARNAALIDGVADEVWAVRLPDRLVYDNGTDREIRKTVELRPEDWHDAPRRPDAFHHELVLPPHSLRAIALR